MKTKHIKSVLLLLIIGGLVWVYACKKDEYSSRSPFGKSGFHARLTDESVIDPILDDLAKIIAIAQTNEEFRDILLDEAQLDVGRENLVLYFRIKDKVLPTSNIPVKKLFADISSQLNLSYDSAWFDCGIVQDLPQLNLNLVVTDDEIELLELEAWDLALVLAASSDFEAEGEYLQTAYDYDLVAYQVSNNTEPEDQYIMGGNACPRFIVVENNTGLLIVDNSWNLENQIVSYGFSSLWEYHGVVPNQEMKDALDSARAVSNTDIYIPLTLCGYSGNGMIARIGIGELIDDFSFLDFGQTDPILGDDCPRDYYDDYEEITQIEVVHSVLKKFCKWWKKECQIRFISTAVSNPTSPVLTGLSKRLIAKRKDIKKDETFEIPINKRPKFFKWWYLEGLVADPYRFDIVGIHHKADESDAFGISINVPVKFITKLPFTPTLSYQHTIKYNDENLEATLVYYCEEIAGLGEMYDTGAIQIWVREKH